MRKKKSQRALAGAQKGLPRTPQTGEHCPNSGWWAPASNPTKGYFISEGSLMPPHDGETVSWVHMVNPVEIRREYDDPAPWHPGTII